MPAKVLLDARASVTAGLANEVDAVNQYAALMYAPTAKGVVLGRLRELDKTTNKSPNVAITSLRNCPPPERT
jgi:hypothetical protein